jgi:hypothetical protein
MSDTPKTENTDTPVDFLTFIASAGYDITEGRVFDPIYDAVYGALKTAPMVFLAANSATEEDLLDMASKVADFNSKTADALAHIVTLHTTLSNVKTLKGGFERRNKSEKIKTRVSISVTTNTEGTPVGLILGKTASK